MSSGFCSKEERRRRCWSSCSTDEHRGKEGICAAAVCSLFFVLCSSFCVSFLLLVAVSATPFSFLIWLPPLFSHLLLSSLPLFPSFRFIHLNVISRWLRKEFILTFTFTRSPSHYNSHWCTHCGEVGGAQSLFFFSLLFLFHSSLFQWCCFYSPFSSRLVRNVLTVMWHGRRSTAASSQVLALLLTICSRCGIGKKNKSC